MAIGPEAGLVADAASPDLDVPVDDALRPDAFLAALLGDLRTARFAPPAWLRFLVRSWEQSLADARAYPALVASTGRWTLALLAVAALGLLPLYGGGPAGAATRATALALAGLAVQQGFVWLHLGMVQAPAGGPRLGRLGLANGLTLLRLLTAWLLLADGLTGAGGRGLLLGLFLAGALTDGVDGTVARRWGAPTRLGRMLDGLADALLLGVGAAVLAGHGLLPAWSTPLVWLRFLLPFAWALVSYFLQLRPVRYAPTRWGKAAGLAVTLVMLVVLLDPRPDAGGGKAALLAAAVALLVAAVAVQFAQERRRWAGGRGDAR